MSKLIYSFCILFFVMIVAVPQDLSAQNFIQGIYKTSKLENRRKVIIHRRNKCGGMDAYNKKRAYKRHKPGVFTRLFSSRKAKPAVSRPVAEREQVVKKTSPPAKTVTSTTTPPGNPIQAPPLRSTPEKISPPPQAGPVAEKTPLPANEPQPSAAIKTKAPVLDRSSLKKMTESERRDTLLQIKPDIILTPLQFISDQDEFSVVNMDSFIQAMEYAQGGKIVLVEGHTDDLGSEIYNLNLSMKRAEKIRELLLSGGISDELISVIGYGESQPVVPNTSDTNRSINRRIEFKIFSLPE